MTTTIMTSPAEVGVRAAWVLPAPLLAQHLHDWPDSRHECDSCRADQARAYYAGRVPPLRRPAVAWVWEFTSYPFEDGYDSYWTRACGRHADQVQLVNSVYGVLYDDDPLLTETICPDCAHRYAPNGRAAEIRMQMTDLTTVDVCEPCAQRRAGTSLPELLGELVW